MTAASPTRPTTFFYPPTNRLRLCVLVLSTLIGAATARDASYALPIRLPIAFASGGDGGDQTTPASAPTAIAVYRLVSLAWLRHLQTTDRPRIWISVDSLPDSWNGLDLRASTNVGVGRALREDAAREIATLAASVLREYISIVKPSARPLIRTTVTSGDLRPGSYRPVEPVDTTGVRVDYYGPFANSAEDAYVGSDASDGIEPVFNRTISLSFERPPYGQSRPNRLVTNVNVPWHNLPHLRYFRSRRQTIIDTTDLRYRYMHNIGHLLGFGHFVGVRDLDQLDRRILADIGKRRLPTLVVTPDGQTAVKSVMYADTKNASVASQLVTRFDALAMRYLFSHLDALMEHATRYIAAGSYAKSLAAVLLGADRYLADN